MQEAAEQEAGPEEQDEGEGDLQDHQASLQALVTGARCLSSSDPGWRAGTASGGGADRRQQAREGRAHQGDEGGERQRPDADRQADARRQIDAARIGQKVKREPGEQQPQRSSQRGGQQVLGEQLAREPGRGRAERGAEAQLPLPRQSSHEVQVRHVHTGDQQHERHRAKDRPQGGAGLQAEEIGERQEADVEVAA
jgi:hypothetical protein